MATSKDSRSPTCYQSPASRRGLVSLPLVGGGVTLIGQPSAVAEPVTPDLLEAYKCFLHYEYRALTWDMAEDPRIAGVRYFGETRSDRWHDIRRCISHVNVGDAHKVSIDSSPYARAALVFSTVGCDWRAP